MLQKTLEERKQAQWSRQQLLERLAGYEADEMLWAAKGDATSAGRVVMRVFEEAEAGYLRMVATQLAGAPGVQALLATRAGGHVVFAQAAGLPADMNALLREVLQAAGGKGGGTRDFAQGSAPDSVALEGLLRRARESLGG